MNSHLFSKIILSFYLFVSPLNAYSKTVDVSNPDQFSHNEYAGKVLSLKAGDVIVFGNLETGEKHEFKLGKYLGSGANTAIYALSESEALRIDMTKDSGVSAENRFSYTSDLHQGGRDMQRHNIPFSKVNFDKSNQSLGFTTVERITYGLKQNRIMKQNGFGYDSASTMEAFFQRPDLFTRVAITPAEYKTPKQKEKFIKEQSLQMFRSFGKVVYIEDFGFEQIIWNGLRWVYIDLGSVAESADHREFRYLDSVIYEHDGLSDEFKEQIVKALREGSNPSRCASIFK